MVGDGYARTTSCLAAFAMKAERLPSAVVPRHSASNRSARELLTVSLLSALRHVHRSHAVVPSDKVGLGLASLFGSITSATSSRSARSSCVCSTSSSRSGRAPEGARERRSVPIRLPPTVVADTDLDVVRALIISRSVRESQRMRGRSLAAPRASHPGLMMTAIRRSGGRARLSHIRCGPRGGWRCPEVTRLKPQRSHRVTGRPPHRPMVIVLVATYSWATQGTDKGILVQSIEDVPGVRAAPPGAPRNNFEAVSSLL